MDWKHNKDERITLLHAYHFPPLPFETAGGDWIQRAAWWFCDLPTAGASWIIAFVQCSSRLWLLRLDRCPRPRARSSWLLAQVKPVLCCGSRLLSASGPAACRLACRCQAAPPKQGWQPHSSSEKHRRLPETLRFQSFRGFFLAPQPATALSSRTAAPVWPSLLIPGAAELRTAEFSQVSEPCDAPGFHCSGLWVASFPPVLA